MRRRSALLWASGLFLVGVLVGGLATHLVDSGHWRRGPRGADRFLERLDRDLLLTLDQRERIERIMLESHAAADSLHEEMLPRVREHMRQTRERIRAVLTPEQQPTFDQLVERHRRRAEHFLLDGGHRHHPPPPDAAPQEPGTQEP